MDGFLRRQLERAAKWGDERQVRDLAGTLWRREDGQELREIIKEHAPRHEYYESGSTLYYDGIEIDRQGRVWIEEISNE